MNRSFPVRVHAMDSELFKDCGSFRAWFPSALTTKFSSASCAVLVYVNCEPSGDQSPVEIVPLVDSILILLSPFASDTQSSEWDTSGWVTYITRLPSTENVGWIARSATMSVEDFVCRS